MCRRVDEWTGGRGTSTLTSPPRRNPHSRRRRVVTHLVTGANGSASRHPVAGRDEGTMQARRVQQGCRRVRWVAAAGAIALAGSGAGGQDAPIARNSVVKGKSVAVRVDLGVRRVVTKKQTE